MYVWGVDFVGGCFVFVRGVCFLGAEGGGRCFIWVVCVCFLCGRCAFVCVVVFFVRTSIEDLSSIDRKSMKSVKSVKEKH